MVLRCAGCIMDVQRLVGIGTRQIKSHAQSNFRVGDVFYLVHDFLAALGKLFLELGHQRFGALGVHLFERGARVVRHAVSDHRHRGQYGQHEHQHQFVAKTHGRPSKSLKLIISKIMIFGEEARISRLTAAVKND